MAEGQGASVGVISGTCELDTDQFTSSLNEMSDKLAQFGESIAAAGPGIAEMTTSIFGAEAAMEAFKAALDLAKDAIADVVFEGSKAADVEDAFNHMTEGANLGYDALQKLRDATHNQVDDFELMKMENKDLGAGMKLTAEQMDEMGNAAYALAKTQGIDLHDALEKVNQALLTGRSRSLQMLIGRVDQTAAEEKFAASLNTTTNQLNQEGKVEAVRLEIFDKLSGVTQRVGEMHERLADSVQKAEVWFANLFDQIEIGINKSPVIVQGMLAIQNVLVSTFGGDKQSLVENIVHAVEDFAIAVVNVAQKDLIPFAKVVVDTFTTVENMWQHVVSGWDAVIYSIEAGVQLALKAFAELPGGTKLLGGAIEGLEKDMDDLYNKMAQRDKQVQENNKSDEDWNKTLDEAGTTIGIVANAMETARKGETDAVDVHAKNEEQIKKLSAALDDNSKYLKDNTLNVAANKKEMEAAGAAWEQYYSLLAKRSGDSFAEQKAQIEQWRQDQISKLDLNTTSWSDHWKAINAIADERLSQIGLDTKALYDNSRTMLENNVAAAQKTYDEALANASDYNNTFIQSLADKLRAAQDALRNYGHEFTQTQEQVASSTMDAVAALDKQIADTQKLLTLGGSREENLTTRGGVVQALEDLHGSINGTTSIDDIVALAKAGISLQQMIQNGIISAPGQQALASESVQQLLGNAPVGGAGTAGSNTPVAPVNVNGGGAAALATNSSATSIGTMNFHINGGAQEVATAVTGVLQKTLGLTRQLPQPAR